MTFAVGDQVERLEQRAQVGAVVLAVVEDWEGQCLELAYEEGGTGWWPASCVKPAEAP